MTFTIGCPFHDKECDCVIGGLKFPVKSLKDRVAEAEKNSFEKRFADFELLLEELRLELVSLRNQIALLQATQPQPLPNLKRSPVLGLQP